MKSNQRITKIKEDLILKLLEQAESMNIEDAVVVQPAGSQLLERPVKGHYRQYVRNNFLKGVNGILLIGDEGSIVTETPEVLGDLDFSTVTTRNDTFTAILDGLVFMTRRYKAPITKQILEPNPESPTNITGKPMLQFPNITFSNIYARTVTNSPTGEEKPTQNIFQWWTSGFIPITLAETLEISQYHYIQLGLSDTKTNYSEVSEYGYTEVRTNQYLCENSGSIAGAKSKMTNRVLSIQHASKGTATIFANECKYLFPSLLLYPIPMDNRVINPSNSNDLWLNTRLRGSVYSQGGCVYKARNDCVPCNPSPPPTNDPPPNYNECPMVGLFSGWYTPSKLDFSFNGLSRTGVQFRIADYTKSITHTTVGYPIPNCRPK